MVPVGPGNTVSPHPFVFPQMSKSDNFGEKMKEFMQKYDKNSDGKIEMAEVSPTSWLKLWGRGVPVTSTLPSTSVLLGL